MYFEGCARMCLHECVCACLCIVNISFHGGKLHTYDHLHLYVHI